MKADKKQDILKKDIDTIEKVFDRIDWRLFSSLYLGGSLIYSPFELHGPKSDIDIFAVSKEENFVENVLSFTSFETPPPSNIFIDSLETVFKNIPDTSRKISIHVFNKSSIHKIVNLSDKPFFVWRTPATGFTYEWLFRSTEGNCIKKQIDINEYDNAYLCKYNITYKKNNLVYYGTHVQQLITFGVPIKDDNGFFTDNILKLQYKILSKIRNYKRLHEYSVSQYWSRHDLLSLSLIRLRAKVSNNIKEIY
jgi:hypothetical protein